MDAFAAHLRGVYAEATASRTIKRCRQFFKAAGRRKLISENAAEGVKAGSQVNPARRVFVERGVVDKLIDACASVGMRLVIALARYGGLRIPSELRELTSGDVNWERGRFTVRLPKQEKMKDGGIRVVPILPELKPYLDRKATVQIAIYPQGESNPCPLAENQIS